MNRPSGRKENELRDIHITRNYTSHAEGSVLIQYGETKLICTASVVDGVPPFLRGQKKGGWLTAEYGMLPRATSQRTQREAARGKQTGRTQEIQRLIGRSLRQAIDLSKLKEYTIQIDCDVIQADGGTRTAAITGACVALYDAVQHMKNHGKVKSGDPFNYFVAAVSVGISNGTPVLDLDYLEDSNAHTDMNIVMTEHNKLIEVQGTAEGAPFSLQELNSMTSLAQKGIEEIVRKQMLAIEA